jgi:alanine-glyoxylate transaminase/serine-glyoxylate transaminase/serine-pyruvate transaminase
MSLLMIPGPIEVSPAVREAFAVPPPSHVAPHVIEAFGASVEKMRSAWKASADSQPFIVAGSGTLAMEMAATNVVEPGDTVVVVNTGYFSDRMGNMLERRGAHVTHVGGALGTAPSADKVAQTVRQVKPKAVFATHVDTSTGVRIDAEMVCRAAREVDALTVFDGVCATVAETFEMQKWGADIYLTGSQKAVGLPPGLALLVASPRALAAREALTAEPPMSIDFHQWIPIMRAYEARKPSYFATPATNLILALDAGLTEIVDEGIDAVFARHERVAGACRRAWAALGLTLVPESTELAANSLSAIRYPDGIDSTVVGAIKERGVVVAGGLHPKMKTEYFRVGHMGWVTTQQDLMERTVGAVGDALAEHGHGPGGDAAVEAYRG